MSKEEPQWKEVASCPPVRIGADARIQFRSGIISGPKVTLMVDLEEVEGLTPSMIGPYRLARRLGRGGMGEVFLAWDERLGRRVAIKRILRDNPRPQDRERFRREARAAARLSHPAVVQVYDFVEDPAGDAIVLEYVEGRTLKALLTDGVPPIGLAVCLAREIAEGLAAAHVTGLVHRDLKAENVVVTSEGRAKILDFGIAKVPDGGTLTAQGVALGTAHAMSPEQARGDEVDARSDLFSLGILLYELLTGISPFRGSNALDELQRVISHRPQPVSRLRPEIPRALSTLVDRLLAKRCEDRPHSAEEVARELGSVATLPVLAANETLAATGSTMAELPAGFAAPAGLEVAGTAPHSRRLPVVILAILLAAVILSVSWSLRQTPTAPLRVVVLEPQVAKGATLGDDGDLLASGLLNATVFTLASLEGLAPFGPSEVPTPASAKPAEVARAAAASEVIGLRVERRGGAVRVSLRRIAGADGRVLWTATFPLPAGRGDKGLRLLAGALAVQLRQAYPDHRRRPGVPNLAVSDRGYAELLRIKGRLDRGVGCLEPPLDPEMSKLEAVVQDSPRFLEGHLLLAELAQYLFSSRRNPAHLEAGFRAAAAAAALASRDPRPIVARFRLAVAARRHDEAEAALEELSRIAPGDPQLHAYAGELADSREDLDLAAREWAAAFNAVPSWINLGNLVSVEARAGRRAMALRRMEEQLAKYPGDHWILNVLAGLEMGNDPERAERIYFDLARQDPSSINFVNLGEARTVLGRHVDAAEAYRRALALDPDDPHHLLVVADGEFALGRTDEARRLCSRALENLDRAEQITLHPLGHRMLRARCLVHLGRTQEAIKITQQVLRERGDETHPLIDASLVYALSGDYASALAHAEAALRKGANRRQFTRPIFGPLSYDPKIQALLKQD